MRITIWRGTWRPCLEGSLPRPQNATAAPFKSVRRLHRIRTSASDPEHSDATGQEPVELPATKLDWRHFRASLVAAEKREVQQCDDAGQAQERSSGAPSTSGSEQHSPVWAHLITAPETGCLLLSKTSAGDMGFFNNSVILLLQHDSNTGSLGLMLGRKLKKSPQGAFAKVIALVTGIYIGGPVGIDKILTLHGPPAMEDSLELLEDLYVGGWRGAQARVEEAGPDAKSLPELSIYAGSCGWTRQQLEHEERTGAWWVVSASPQCVRELLTGTHTEADIRSTILSLAGVLDHEEETS